MKAAAIAARLGKAISIPANTPVPKGWFTVRDIQQALNMKWAANASTRAKNFHERGLVDRMEWRAYKDYGFARAFIYRLKKPYRTWQEVAEAYANVGAHTVPKGWHRPVHFARMFGISPEAIRNSINRYDLPTKFFLTKRGVSGLHANLHVHEKDILRVYGKRLKAS